MMNKKTKCEECGKFTDQIKTSMVNNWRGKRTSFEIRQLCPACYDKIVKVGWKHFKPYVGLILLVLLLTLPLIWLGIVVGDLFFSYSV